MGAISRTRTLCPLLFLDYRARDIHTGNKNLCGLLPSESGPDVIRTQQSVRLTVLYFLCHNRLDYCSPKIRIALSLRDSFGHLINKSTFKITQLKDEPVQNDLPSTLAPLVELIDWGCISDWQLQDHSCRTRASAWQTKIFANSQRVPKTVRAEFEFEAYPDRFGLYSSLDVLPAFSVYILTYPYVIGERIPHSVIQRKGFFCRRKTFNRNDARCLFLRGLFFRDLAIPATAREEDRTSQQEYTRDSIHKAPLLRHAHLSSVP